MVPQVAGLDCIYCGKPTGSNTDMCVPCAMKREKERQEFDDDEDED